MPLGSGIEKNQEDLVLGESRVLQGDPFPEGLDAGHRLGSLPWFLRASSVFLHVKMSAMIKEFISKLIV